MTANLLSQEAMRRAQKLGRNERFRNQSLVFPERTDGVENIGTPGCVDYRDQGKVPAHQVRDLDAVVLARHMNVSDEQGESGRRVPDEQRRLIAVLGLLHLKVRVGERLSDKKADQRFIFNNENAQSLPGASWCAHLPLDLTHWSSIWFAEPRLGVCKTKPCSSHTNLRAPRLSEGRQP